MATAARVALRPNSEAPRRSCQTERGTTNFNSSNADENSLSDRLAQQHLVLVPPIIATHWLRPDPVEAPDV